MRIRAILLLICLLGTTAFADTLPAGEIAGTVTDEDGHPIEGALVDCWTWYKGNETRTDKAGHFHLKGLAADTPFIELRISHDGLSPWYQENQPTGVDDLNVKLNDKTFFEGTVLTPDGKPMPKARVRADSGPKKNKSVHISSVWTETKADEQGHYKLMVAPDNYVLEVADAKVGILRLKATAGVDQSVTQDLKLEAGIRLVINCVDDADQQPIPDVRVDVVDHKGMSVKSDKNGQAVFEHLPAEPLEFYFKSETHMRWWMAESLVEEQRTLKTNVQWSCFEAELDPSTRTEPVTVHMEKGVTFTGKVLDPHDQPVAGAIVVTNRVGYGDAVDQTKRFTAKTGKDGTFTLVTPACEDPMNLIGHDGDYGKTRQWANGVTEPLEAVTATKHENITIKLASPGQVKGKLLNLAGQPIVRKAVRVINSDGRDSRYVAQEAITDSQGNFDLDFLRPGDSLLQVGPFSIRQPNGPVPEITSQQVTVTSDETVEGLTVTIKQ
jgi:protocatechuate 3,4-dioxygenase beta subunit